MRRTCSIARSRSLPEYDKDLAVAGAADEIEIVRDNAAVPHIFARSDRDAYFGLGYAHAQDRIWQMVLMRRTAQGRLSEVFGNQRKCVAANPGQGVGFPGDRAQSLRQFNQHRISRRVAE